GIRDKLVTGVQTCALPIWPKIIQDKDTLRNLYEIVFTKIADMLVKFTEKQEDYAEDKGIDLIVIGTRGKSGFKKLLLGSVATNEIGRASCRERMIVGELTC